VHEFPKGFSAHWIQVKSDKACVATAWLIYDVYNSTSLN
jgi:hypothetical protein